MKTSMKQLVTIAIIATFAATLTATAEIQTAKGGAQRLLNPAPATITESVALTAPAAMACSKCQTVKATYADTSRGRVTELRTVEQHVCPGCATRIKATGHGKAKTESVIHTCSLTDKGASCCL